MAASSRIFYQLTDTEYLLNNCMIDRNVDPKLLNQSLIDAQEIHIQQVLGNALYNKVMKMLNDQNITGAYQILNDDYIGRAQAYWAWYLVTPFLNYKFTNKSVSEQRSDQSEPTSMSNIITLRDEIRDRAEYYTKRIRQFIVNNESELPEYTMNTDIDAILPDADPYFCGVQFKKKGCNRPGPWPGNSINLI